jgi:beta-lactamase class D
MKQFFTVLLVLCVARAYAADWKESPGVGDLFNHAGVSGTFVLYDVAADTFIGHDRARAEQRFVPASTFKIANTLIGLAAGAVRDVDEPLPYGGRPQAYKTWEKDMGLREAIAMSNVPIYQELARRIGLERMRDNIERIDYGNAEIGDTVDNFWLRGPLRISAVEQTRFLAALALEALPYPREVQRNVREIILLDQGEGWTLYGKTGWENAPGQGVGWWVGWVQKAGRVYAFALNMDMQNTADTDKRVTLGTASLGALGILDAAGR